MINDIHPSSIIAEGAILGQNIKIGPFCLVGSNVVLGDNVVLHSHVVVEGKTIIGEGTKIFPFASVGHIPQDLKYKGEESSVLIGKNTVIREYVTIQPGTESGAMKTVVGDNCLLMAGTHIAHDCLVGNNVIFANLATLAGHVTVGDFSVLGGLSAVHQWVRIGEQVMIGGGSIVLRDVVPFSTIVSDREANIENLNLIGLKRRGFDKQDIFNLQKAFKKIFFNKDKDFNTAVKEVKEEFEESELVMQLVNFMESESRRSFATAKKV